MHMNVSTSAQDGTRKPHRVGEILPAVLSPADLMRVLGFTRSAFYRLHKQGQFKRFEIKRAIGLKKYSGRLVQAYLDARD